MKKNRLPSSYFESLTNFIQAMEPVHVLLAGDREYSKFLLEGRNKCLLEFKTGLLFERTLRALQKAVLVKRVLVVGPELIRPLLPESIAGKPISLLLQKGSFSENLLAALDWIKLNHPGSPAIFLTNDAPLLTSEELDEFADSVERKGGGIHIAVYRVEPKTLTDPLVRQYVRSIVALTDGLFILANQVSLSVDNITLLKAAQKIFDLRKQSWYSTSFRTFYYIIREWGSMRNIISWLRLILAKKLWLMSPGSPINAWLGMSLGQTELHLSDAIGEAFGLRVTEIPNALGAFDADTPLQLEELRRVVEREESAVSKVEAVESGPLEVSYARMA